MGSKITKSSYFAIIILAVSSPFLVACGSHSGVSGKGDYYVTRSVGREEVEKLLKFDSRVEDFETDGDNLIVNVNADWVNSPPGVQQFSLGQWLKHWQEGLGDNRGKVIVRYEGDNVATATAERGIEFVPRKKRAEES